MKYLFISLLVLASCSTNKVSPLPTVVIEPQEIPAMPVEVVKGQIILSASTSSAAKIKWLDRGVAPAGYIKGMALVYARAYCRQSEILDAQLGSSDKDALAYYGVEFGIRSTFALLIGLGMRESSGVYCEGRDMSAKNVTATSAEAGLFQTSYDSNIADKTLPLLVTQQSNCYLEVFKEGITCKASQLKSYGTGIGFTFQEKAKSCPAFAADYAAITLRKLRKHYGPINRKEAQFKREVLDMLVDIEGIVNANPSVCAAL